MTDKFFSRIRHAGSHLRPGRDDHPWSAPVARVRARWDDWRRRRATRAVVRTAGSVGKTKRFLAARYRWIIVVAIAVAVGAGMYSYSRTPVYKAGTDVLVGSSILTTSTAQIPDMGSEKAVASSGVVLAAAARSLHVPVSAVASGLSVSVPLDTHVLTIGYAATDPAVAQQRAQAVAEAYVANWQSRQVDVSTRKTSSSPSAPATSIITPAVLPAAPASPNHMVDILVGVIVGLALGFGTALWRDRLDDRLRSPSDLTDRVGAPLLAQLPPVRSRGHDHAGSPLVVLNAPGSRVAAAYRDLRTHVVLTAKRSEAKTLLVTCPATERKSLVAANLAVALAKAGYRVTFVCADPGSRFAEHLFGANEADRERTSANVRTGLARALRDTPVEGLRILPGEVLAGDHDVMVHGATFRRLLADLRTADDYVIVDGPPVLVGADAGAIAELVDMVVIVGDARRTTRRQVDAAVRRLEDVHTNVIGCVLDNLGHRSRVPVARPTAPIKRNGAVVHNDGTGVLADIQAVATQKGR